MRRRVEARAGLKRGDGGTKGPLLKLVSREAA
jgi:hypothetical protein